ncbi:MAG: hypothetical protein OEP48_02170 [Betaproteobacteria bacterium]|nr:hypothetical protein [Betaproteobacteria bacterium]MDH3438523.1 hypothetical protein [Betaproteobacteria bacterium]
MPRVLLDRCLAGVLLVLVSPPALAQKVPLWVVAGVLSPVLALVLVIALALCAPGLGKAGLHFKLLLLWIVAFLLASFFIENDWVIWTPMHLYILHLALLPIFVFYQLLRRLEPSALAPSRTLLLGFLSVLLSVPTTLFVTSLSILPWEYFGKVTGIDTKGTEGPAPWCFLATWIVLQSGMLVVWMIHRHERRTKTSGDRPRPLQG